MPLPATMSRNLASAVASSSAQTTEHNTVTLTSSRLRWLSSRSWVIRAIFAGTSESSQFRLDAAAWATARGRVRLSPAPPMSSGGPPGLSGGGTL